MSRCSRRQQGDCDRPTRSARSLVESDEILLDLLEDPNVDGSEFFAHACRHLVGSATFLSTMRHGNIFLSGAPSAARRRTKSRTWFAKRLRIGGSSNGEWPAGSARKMNPVERDAGVADRVARARDRHGEIVEPAGHHQPQRGTRRHRRGDVTQRIVESARSSVGSNQFQRKFTSSVSET